jgi:polysaccharide biosynthesis protein PslG
MALINIGFNQVELSIYGQPGVSGAPPAADIATVVAGLSEIGATWVRIGAFWQYLEAVQGVYLWTYLDAALEAVTNAGMQVLLVPDATPTWQPTPTAFAALCTQLVQRYGPGGTAGLAIPVRHWEIWNEPNSLVSAPPNDSGPAGMYAYQQAAYSAIKAVDSGADVGSAGLLPTVSGFGITDAVTWLTDMYAAGPSGGPYPWDFVCFHPYSSTDAGAQEPTTTQVWIAEIPSLHQVMVANGDGAKPIWPTEFGFLTQPSGVASGIYVTPTQQAQYLVEQIHNMAIVASAAGVTLGPLFIYNYRDSGSDDGSGTSDDGAGVVTYAFQQKPAWAAIQALIGGGAPVGVLSGTGTLDITPAITGTGTGPSGVKVGAGADQITIAGTGTGAVAVPGQATALWAGGGVGLLPITAPMSSMQSLIDDVVGIPGATVSDLIGALQTAANTAGGAAEAAAQAGGDLVTIITTVVGDLAAEAVDLADALTGTNTNGVANTNAIAALQAQGISGMAGIIYNFGNATPLTNDFPGTTNPAWTIPSGFPSPIFGGSNYVVNTTTPAPMVFTGNPEASATDHGLITDQNQVFITLESLPFGFAALFLSGHGTTTLGQNVELVVSYGTGELSMQINTATGPFSGLTAQGSLYTLRGAPQIGDVIGLQYDGAGHYTMIYNNTAVGLATGETYSWDASGAGLTHGTGYRESGLILFSNGFGAPTIGLGGVFNAVDYTGAGIT